MRKSEKSEREPKEDGKRCKKAQVKVKKSKQERNSEEKASDGGEDSWEGAGGGRWHSWEERKVRERTGRRFMIGSRDPTDFELVIGDRF